MAVMVARVPCQRQTTALTLRNCPNLEHTRSLARVPFRPSLRRSLVPRPLPRARFPSAQRHSRQSRVARMPALLHLKRVEASSGTSPLRISCLLDKTEPCPLRRCLGVQSRWKVSSEVLPIQLLLPCFALLQCLQTSLHKQLCLLSCASHGSDAQLTFTLLISSSGSRACRRATPVRTGRSVQQARLPVIRVAHPIPITRQVLPTEEGLQ
mmetsp:Transcript_15357/g.42928  ORF Transcript_15357/g.42928 Transcript_15357/m.42928 type:complete len:210 (-) Transcript_15357:841-1470(-)